MKTSIVVETKLYVDGQRIGGISLDLHEPYDAEIFQALYRDLMAMVHEVHGYRMPSPADVDADSRSVARVIHGDEESTDDRSNPDGTRLVRLQGHDDRS